jgi:hypothetical protein
VIKELVPRRGAIVEIANSIVVKLKIKVDVEVAGDIQLIP